LFLPQDGCLIDTPGMRELQLWHADLGLNETFADIESLAINCRFSDCTHTKEIKCAVLEALKNGELSMARYNNYIKLQRELAYLEANLNKSSYLERKEKVKAVHRAWNKIKRKRT